MIRRAFLSLALALLTSLHGVPAGAAGERLQVRMQAVLEQARAAELGVGVGKNLMVAMALYCDAGTMGSAEGFYHLGRVLATAPRALRNPGLANSYLALAIRLGKRQAIAYYDPGVDKVLLGEPCGAFVDGHGLGRG
ncbi:MAG: hypothetical protein AW10_03866 [Candidatus Accumulibacter appositus]|uniref:Sel1 repeat family protein n=1 Tax=Candidatus Accumulibacter appositus TaxID=1454003 RepID=A0A011QEW1_9PROT|nr:hypothetical protein [Accumulibacter sp.]EXI77314.1 MAG: hypothetical protein AW10_03866 [Candidatus Accumulibacter appositus]HRF05641.1 hypothetical protein [Accumulibacter sp.]